MGCNSCNKKPTILCGCEKKLPKCGCDFKVNTECVHYNGSTLIPLGLVNGDNMEDALVLLNDTIADIKKALEEGMKITNIGVGSELYKGINSDGYAEFKTLMEGAGIKLVDHSNGVEIQGDNVWIEQHISDALRGSWLENKFRNLLENAPWFTDVLKQNFKQEWFNQVLKERLKQEWFKTHLKESLKETWFKDTLKEVLKETEFKTFMSEYITKMVQEQTLDLCTLVRGCSGNQPPIARNDIRLNVPNKGLISLSENNFNQVYFDAEGDPYTAVRITGGDLTGLTLNGVPVTTGQVIPKASLNLVQYNAKFQDAAYEQVVNYEFVQ